MISSISRLLQMDNFSDASLVAGACVSVGMACVKSDCIEIIRGVAMVAIPLGAIQITSGLCKMRRNKRSAIKQIAFGACLLGAAYLISRGIATYQAQIKLIDKMQKKMQETERRLQESEKRLQESEDRLRAIDGREFRHITFGTTYAPGSNDNRVAITNLAKVNQQEYANRWDMEYEAVEKNLVAGQCAVADRVEDCQPYWNKIKLIKNWLDRPIKQSRKEEWYIFADDDMVVTNMKVNPYRVIDQLRKGSDTSFISTQDIQQWNADWTSSVNTGFIAVRKDENGRRIIDEIWERRNEIGLTSGENAYKCPTLGTCRDQLLFHEQQALGHMLELPNHLQRAMLWIQSKFSDVPKGFRDLITVVAPGDGNPRLGVNTIYRPGIMCRGKNDCLSYERDDSESAKWIPGDWMGQPSGVPIMGLRRNEFGALYPLRLSYLKEMLAKVIR